MKLGTNTLNLVLNMGKGTIIKGTVYAGNHMPSVGAAIKVVEINPCNNQKKILGYTYTDDKGEYQFRLVPMPCMVYEFIAYSPLRK